MRHFFTVLTGTPFKINPYPLYYFINHLLTSYPLLFTLGQDKPSGFKIFKSERIIQ